MKALFVNGSPRKNWNTHKMLESAAKGAAEAGAETEIVHLYDMAFKGCVSCFACKVKGNRTNGLCAFRDPLTPVLEKARAADVIVIGSPVYFSYPTGPTRSFLERLMFPVLAYKTEGRRILKRTVPTAMIYTMNCTEEMMDQVNYPVLLSPNAGALEMLFGYSETLYSCDTMQFTDYSRYDVTLFDGDHKAQHREEQFPKDLQNAFDLGKRLVQKAVEMNQ
ncbi:MAG: flavodoxin family protein [Pyramidobacter sp.]|nr:flavodoxin family protein [Pyramidobacter sp.]MBR0107576.1 flavodoxin family protein [Pyramidobacter sp.]